MIYSVAAVVLLVRALRELGPVRRWVLAGTKPWACDLCMCLWSAATVTALRLPPDLGDTLIQWWGRAMLALVALELLVLVSLQARPELPELPVRADHVDTPLQLVRKEPPR